MALSKETINKLIGDNVTPLAEIIKKYPPRPEGEVVTRFAPSPTGFVHIGHIYTSLIDERIAHQKGGKFILRVEDTDTKREVKGATDLVISTLKDFVLPVDEGPNSENEGDEKGSYGSYFQSRRQSIYLSGVQYLLEKGLAYPCFCTSEELEEIRKEQTAYKLRPGYYGKWAKYRNHTEEQILEKLASNTPFIIRFKSNGDWDKKQFFDDIVRGKLSMPENDMDIVILKSDGLPTYHFAHIMDDHLMGTTHVIRADEWIASLPLHVQMFEAFGWKAPLYAHTAPIQKLDDGNRRKLSKRKDPEATITYYFEQGYPIEAVKEYLMNLANSNFEDFKKANPENALEKFELKLENLNTSGPLLDFKKLENVSKEFIATLSSEKLFERLYDWAKTYDKSLQEKMDKNKDYIKLILSIERDGCEKVRKDFYIFSKIWDEIAFFFDDSFSLSKEKAIELISNQKEEDIKILTDAYIKTYNENHSKEEWFNNIKEIAFANGYAKNPKEQAKEPDKYKGSISDVAKVFRVLITGRTESPDLYAIMHILGKDKALQRIKLI